MNVGRAITRLPRPVKLGLLSVKRFYHALFSPLPLPALLPYGGVYLAWNDYNGDSVFTGGNAEEAYNFVDSYLRPGMTAIDVGAHHGYYTVLSSKRVGHDGKVVAFEPSLRERRKLRMNLHVNRCSNVQVEPFALSDYDGWGTLYVVTGHNTGCNSLKPPNLDEPTRSDKVGVETLDTYLQKNQLLVVHLLKIDAEGAELNILRGAHTLLSMMPQPAIVCEVMDVRTRPWGYDSVRILEFVEAAGYAWFNVSAKGALEPLDVSSNPQGTFVALPRPSPRAQGGNPTSG